MLPIKSFYLFRLVQGFGAQPACPKAAQRRKNNWACRIMPVHSIPSGSCRAVLPQHQHAHKDMSAWGRRGDREAGGTDVWGRGMPGGRGVAGGGAQEVCLIQPW